MDLKKLVFVAVDCQKDLFEEGGSFLLDNANSIRENLGKLTQLAGSKRVKVVNTMNWRTEDSEGLSDSPDYLETFPKHCLMNTEGTRFIKETSPSPSETMLIDWEPSKGMNFHNMHNHRNIIIRKNHFDLFLGNSFSEAIINNLGIPFLDRPTFVVYGVPTGLSLKSVVEGIAKRGYQVYVVTDAVTGFTGDENIVNDWIENNVVKGITTNEMIKKFE